MIAVWPFVELEFVAQRNVFIVLMSLTEMFRSTETRTLNGEPRSSLPVLLDPRNSVQSAFSYSLCLKLIRMKSKDLGKEHLRASGNLQMAR